MSLRSRRGSSIPTARCLFTGADITAGQEIFFRNGLMEYGSIFGHGAYLGPDFTADYLHRAALMVIDTTVVRNLNQPRTQDHRQTSKQTATTAPPAILPIPLRRPKHLRN